MDSELENEKFSSLYLEQALSDPKELDALIHQRENASAIADNIVARVSDSALEQQALLQDMFRLVSREGAHEIIDNADAVFTLFQNPALDSIFSANGDLLSSLYIKAVQAQKKQRPEDIYGAIDKLLEIGKRIAPFLSRGRTRQITSVWDAVKNQFRGLDDRIAIYSRIEEIYDAVNSSPKMSNKLESTDFKKDKTPSLPDFDNVNEDNEAVVKDEKIKKMYQSLRDDLAIIIAKAARDNRIPQWTVRRLLKLPGKTEGIMKRKSGPVAPLDLYNRVLLAIKENPDWSYAEIATKLNIEPKKVGTAVRWLQDTGELEKKKTWKRGLKSKK